MGEAHMRLGLLVSAVAIGLSGCCVVFDATQTLVNLYDPQTGAKAQCGQSWHRNNPTPQEFSDRAKCVADYEAQGYKLTPEDQAKMNSPN